MSDRSTRVAYRPLGALRLFLAVAVVMGHGAWLLGGSTFGTILTIAKPGTAAVFSFFMLSGFILSEACATFYDGRPSAFAKNRVLKIAPIFVTALLISVALHYALATRGMLADGLRFEHYQDVPRDLFSFGNLAFNAVSALPTGVGDIVKSAFGLDERYIFVRYVWAVRAEVLFYALLALGLWLAVHWPALRRFALAAVWAAIGAAALCLIWRFSKDYSFAPHFIVGVCLFHASRDRRFVAPGLVALMLSIAHAWDYLEGSWPALACWAAFAAASAALCLRAARGELFRRWDRSLGDISYSLYLNQYVVLVAIGAFWPEARGVWVWTAAVLAAIAFGALLHIAVERPLFRLRRSIRSSETAARRTVVGSKAFEPSRRPN